MKKKNNLLKKATGVILIILGIIGLFLPFLQGIVLIIIGTTLIDNKYISNLAKKLIKKVKVLHK